MRTKTGHREWSDCAYARTIWLRGTLSAMRRPSGVETSYASNNYKTTSVSLTHLLSGTFTFDNQRFPVEDVSNPAALAEKLSNDSEPADKRRTDAIHATVRHLLDFYREEFPGLEGQNTPFYSDEF